MAARTKGNGRITPKKASGDNADGLRWILYYRLSIGDANMERDNARQHAELQALVARLGGVIVAELGLDDRSASEFATRKRDDYATAMRMIDRGEANAIAFSRVDRILRRMDECVDLLRRVRDTDLEVWDCSEDEELRLNTPTGRKRLQDRVNDAEYEAAIISWRTKRATAARRAAGLPHPAQCWGWKDSTTLDPDGAKLIRRMVTRVLKGESVASVARWLDSQGVARRKSSRAWTGGAVTTIVTEPRNYGLMVWDGKVTPLSIPGAVEPELYGQMLDTLSHRKPADRPRRALELAGLILCADCEQPMIRGTSGRSGRPVLRCMKQAHTSRCGAGNIDYGVVDEYVQALVFEAVDDLDLADLLAPSGPLNGDELRAEQERVEAMLKEATRAHFAGESTKIVYDTACDVANRRLDEISDVLTSHARVTVLADYVGAPGALAREWPELAPSARARIITEALDLKHLRITVAAPAPGGFGSLGCNVRLDPDDADQVAELVARIAVEATG